MSTPIDLRQWLGLLLGIACVGALASPGIAAAAPDEPVAVIQPSSSRSAYFGGEKTELRYLCTSAVPQATRLLWEYSADARTLARGEQAIPFAANQPVEFTLPIELPPVREGITFATQMVLTLVDANGQELARSEETIWLFPEDPYVARREWLKQLNIHLYDPDGATTAIFEEAEIPFTKVANSNVLADLENGLLIVGEGNSLRSVRAISGALFSLPQRDVSVLCLSPIDGELPWPTREVYPQMASVRFSSKQVVRQLDKRLSPDFASPSNGPEPPHGMSLVSRRGQLTLQISDSPEAWPWWQVEFENHGTAIICCLNLVEHWNESPTPRFLLARILEILSSEPTSSLVEQ